MTCTINILLVKNLSSPEQATLAITAITNNDFTADTILFVLLIVLICLCKNLLKNNNNNFEKKVITT